MSGDQHAFINRLHEYRLAIAHESGNKHTICLDALKDQPQSHLNETLLDDWLQRCEDICGEVDFEIVVLIRLLYLIHRKSSTIFTSIAQIRRQALDHPGILSSLSSNDFNQQKEVLKFYHRIVRKIEKSLSVFPFWPHEGVCRMNADRLVFWSENHIVSTTP